MLKNVFDNLRSAPFGVSLVAFNAGTPLKNVGEAAETILLHTPYEVLDLLAIPFSAGGIAVGELFITRQLVLKHRLEESLGRIGYNDRIFSLTTDEWCARQTARVVCKNAGVLPDYIETCDRRSDTARLKMIPHI